MASLAAERLKQERKACRRDLPFGYSAKPSENADGTKNLMAWRAKIPGKKGTPWENGVYSVDIIFKTDFPIAPPTCMFNPPIFHPNVYDDGLVCLSLLDADGDWKPEVSIKQLLIGLQDLLNTPNLKSPASASAYAVYTKDVTVYEERIRKQARTFAST